MGGWWRWWVQWWRNRTIIRDKSVPSRGPVVTKLPASVNSRYVWMPWYDWCPPVIPACATLSLLMVHILIRHLHYLLTSILITVGRRLQITSSAFQHSRQTKQLSDFLCIFSLLLIVGCHKRTISLINSAINTHCLPTVALRWTAIFTLIWFDISIPFFKLSLSFHHQLESITVDCKTSSSKVGVKVFLEIKRWKLWL